MPKPPFRVKRYAHGKYKFLVRGKVLGKWRRRYFGTEAEAIEFARQQNSSAQPESGHAPARRNGATEDRKLASPSLAEQSQPEGQGLTTDFSNLAFPAYLGPRIERYLGDSWCMHLPFAYDLMRELRPKVFVELGVKHGESYFSFCQSAAENKINVRCYGVDSWRGDIQTGELDPAIQNEVAEYNWKYSSFSELKGMLFTEALGEFPDASIDLLHIDGTHTYAEVKSDFELWLPKLTPNGIILFHDVIPRDGGFGVWKVWEEIARDDNSFLFEFGFGLGVWKKQPVSPSDPAFVRKLLGASKAEARDINAFYANAAVALDLWHNSQRQPAEEKQIGRPKVEADEGSKQANPLQGELKERSEQVIHFQHELEEKSNHFDLLQEEMKKMSLQVSDSEREAEARTKHIARLQRELEEKSSQVAHFGRENDQRSQLLEKLRIQLETERERLARMRDELLDARWEALTLRGTLLRKTDSAETPSSRVLELENRVETTTSERDHLRAMLASVQNDLEQELLLGHTKQRDLRATQEQLDATQGQLKKLTKQLRSEQQQMDRLRERISHKLILPFGKSQRKLRQLTASKRADD